MLQAVVMAGGSGTRFWPLSRKASPKQFLNLYGDRSLLQQAYDRIHELVGADHVLVVTNDSQVAKTREQLPDLRAENVIGEPCGRDTAACIGLAAALLVKQSPDARMIVLAADHLIRPTTKFHDAVRAADAHVAAHPDALVTFGIPPTNPSTAYGYLRRAADGSTAEGPHGIAVHRLESYHEKPDAATAERFLASGEYYWNSGIFCWRAATILSEIRRRAPQLHEPLERIAAAWGTGRQEEVFAAEFEALPKISIDYAVMEHAENVFMVETPFEWDDVGSWLALERVHEPDAQGNVVLGRRHGLGTENCVIVGTENHLIATLGVRDLIIVHTPDVTLVADRKDEQSVKRLIESLAEAGLEDLL